MPIVFGIFASAWPLYSQAPYLYSDIQVICAAKIYTASLDSPTAECFAYSTSKGVFTSVGSKADVFQKHGTAQLREFGENLTVLPGLYDAHGHIMHVPSGSLKALTSVW
jgi:predicted amidohydrolase YtcJ